MNMHASVYSVVPQKITLATIKRVVCEHYRVTHVDLISARRNKEDMRPRQVAMYLARMHTTLGFPQIGRHMGNRHHTTIMHGVRVTRERMAKDERLRDEIAAIERKLGIGHETTWTAI